MPRKSQNYAGSASNFPESGFDGDGVMKWIVIMGRDEYLPRQGWERRIRTSPLEEIFIRSNRYGNIRSCLGIREKAHVPILLRLFHPGLRMLDLHPVLGRVALTLPVHAVLFRAELPPRMA